MDTETPEFDRLFSHRKVFANGVLLHAVVGGRGPALVLLHGWMGSWYSWRKVMPTLAERFTVIVPDARGYGDSAKPAAGYDGLTIKEGLRQLLRALGHSRAFVMGVGYFANRCWGSISIASPRSGRTTRSCTGGSRSTPPSTSPRCCGRARKSAWSTT